VRGRGGFLDVLHVCLAAARVLHVLDKVLPRLLTRYSTKSAPEYFTVENVITKSNFSLFENVP
jgi:hypothetical protein